MNKQTLGTCSNCGGPVTVDTIYFSVVPPVPTCEGCGARAGHGPGPVIPMGPPRPQQYTTTNGTGIEWPKG